MGFTVERDRLLTALDRATPLVDATRRGIVRLERTQDGAAVAVTVPADSGAPLHQTPVPVRAPRGPAHPLVFNARFARQAAAFLDGPTITVSADTEQLAVYLQGVDRHAIVMQTTT